MTTTFYAPPECFVDGRIVLPEDEARHAVRSLRHGVGDEILVVDGVGGRHRVRLTEVDKRGAEGEVTASEQGVGEPPYRLRLGLGVLKNPGRFETFAEKAVELGVSEIVPLLTERTERAKVKETRLRALLVAAMKQSGRSRLPQITSPQPLKAALEVPADGLRLLCHEAADPTASLLHRLGAGDPIGSATVLVGPEGGFSDAEVAMAEAAGWEVVWLGPRRLRAETAALTAAAVFMLHAAHSSPP